MFKDSEKIKEKLEILSEFLELHENMNEFSSGLRGENLPVKQISEREISKDSFVLEEVGFQLKAE